MDGNRQIDRSRPLQNRSAKSARMPYTGHSHGKAANMREIAGRESIISDAIAALSSELTRCRE